MLKINVSGSRNLYNFNWENGTRYFKLKLNRFKQAQALQNRDYF